MPDKVCVHAHVSRGTQKTVSDGEFLQDQYFWLEMVGGPLQLPFSIAGTWMLSNHSITREEYGKARTQLDRQRKEALVP